jgi:shikimate dehydrogenase
MLEGLDSTTRRRYTFYIIGYPIEHTLSPTMHNAVFKALNIDATYTILKVKDDTLKDAVDALRIRSNGFNVTIPHKVRVIKYMDALDDSVVRVGAVNTVSNSDNILKGYNTDYYGFLQPIKNRGIDVKGMSALILGSGGAARAVISALMDEHIASITLAVRSSDERSDALTRSIRNRGIECNVVILKDVSKYSYGKDIIVNATPLGMKGISESIPLSSKDISSSSVVYDLVYNPKDTQLIKHAKEAGATVIYGYEMLVEQGAKSLEIWLGIDAPRDVMTNAVLKGLQYTDERYRW